METTQRIVLAAHILSGLVSLFAMLPPLLAKKGARVHRRVGWLFVGGMGSVILSGIVLAGLWIGAPERARPDADPAALRLQGTFLVLVALLTANALVQSITSLGRKRSPGASRRALELVPLVALALGALLSLVVGMSTGHVLMVVFAAGSLSQVAADARFTLRALPSRHAHVTQHIRAMGTACISAITAFLVLGGRRWIHVDGSAAILLWVAPGVVLGTVFHVWSILYVRKLERPRAPHGIVSAPAE